MTMGPLSESNLKKKKKIKKTDKEVPNVSRFNPANPFGFMKGTTYVGPLGRK